MNENKKRLFPVALSALLYFLTIFRKYCFSCNRVRNYIKWLQGRSKSNSASTAEMLSRVFSQKKAGRSLRAVAAISLLALNLKLRQSLLTELIRTVGKPPLRRGLIKKVTGIRGGFLFGKYNNKLSGSSAGVIG